MISSRHQDNICHIIMLENNFKKYRVFFRFKSIIGAHDIVQDVSAYASSNTEYCQGEGNYIAHSDEKY